MGEQQAHAAEGRLVWQPPFLQNRSLCRALCLTCVAAGLCALTGATVKAGRQLRSHLRQLSGRQVGAGDVVV